MGCRLYDNINNQIDHTGLVENGTFGSVYVVTHAFISCRHTHEKVVFVSVNMRQYCLRNRFISFLFCFFSYFYSQRNWIIRTLFIQEKITFYTATENK